jgi:hypothetical protein
LVSSASDTESRSSSSTSPSTFSWRSLFFFSAGVSAALGASVSEAYLDEGASVLDAPPVAGADVAAAVAAGVDAGAFGAAAGADDEAGVDGLLGAAAEAASDTTYPSG